MAHVLAIALSFPSVVFTVMLGVVLVYWVFVMVGAAHVNLLGEGAADGAIDGAADGALAGASKGALEGVADHLDGIGHHHGGDLDGLDGADGAGDEVGGLAGVLAALHLRDAPATVVLSCLTLYSWLFSVLAMQACVAWLPRGLMVPACFVVFVLAPLLALPISGLTVRPLAPIFAPRKAATNQGLVGKVCTVRTGKVTDRFGEAFLEDGGAGLVVRVRVDVGDTLLKRGDQALIIGYDDERQEFMVAPVDDALAPRTIAKR